jgi:HAD superfamily hydrolase (TIGR01484 family)
MVEAAGVEPTLALYSHRGLQPFTECLLNIFSAGGGNKDIYNAIESALKREFKNTIVVCANEKNKILGLKKKYPQLNLYSFNNPAGKDGFLAINSLISTCILILKTYNFIKPLFDLSDLSSLKKISFQKVNLNEVLNKSTILGLSAGWGYPALIDLESKFSEIGFRNLLPTDFRNFAHGRHAGLYRNINNTSIIAIETPFLKKLSTKTLSLIPEIIPKLTLSTSYESPLGTLDLLIQVFFLVGQAGKFMNVDPGRPPVPDFGRKIYSLGPIYVSKRTNKANIVVKRKQIVTSLPYDLVKSYFDIFLDRFINNYFMAVISDYDGTLCDTDRRSFPPSEQVSNCLNMLLSNNIKIGIATGRGRSAYRDLRKVINTKHYDQVVLGLYNCSLIKSLADKISDDDLSMYSSISRLHKLMKSDHSFSKDCYISARAGQLSIRQNEQHPETSCVNNVYEIVGNDNNYKVMHSGHSIDILDKKVSKLALLDYFNDNFSVKKEEILCFGDQGQFGGNDFELLSSPFSLSVDQISSSIKTCWNLNPPGARGVNGFLSLFQNIETSSKRLHFLNINYK